MSKAKRCVFSLLLLLMLATSMAVAFDYEVVVTTMIYPGVYRAKVMPIISPIPVTKKRLMIPYPKENK